MYLCVWIQVTQNKTYNAYIYIIIFFIWETPTNETTTSNFPSTQIWCEGFELLAHLLLLVDKTSIHNTHRMYTVHTCVCLSEWIQFNVYIQSWKIDFLKKKKSVLFVPVPHHILDQHWQNIIIIYYFHKIKPHRASLHRIHYLFMCVVTSRFIVDIEI